MKISQFRSNVLPVLLAQKKAFVVWSNPEISKVNMLKEEAEQRGLEFSEIRLGWFSAEDVTPLPYLGPDGGVKYANPTLGFLSDPIASGIMVFDEFETLHPKIQAMVIELVLNRKFFHHTISDDVTIVISCGPDLFRFGPLANQTLANKFVITELESD